ncbi:unnamed protein product [Symbiodinium natans]|uniref:Uncharacterized protein n=1 Tax=Symbiodinium natans TaxID=878477 RepID=A0A812RDC7_9DINO|nr:unnamed protein product [Symbiodinium natans]
MPSAFLWFFQLFFFALLASSAGLVHHGQGTGLAQAPEACPLSSANSTAHLRGRNASGPQYCPEGGIKAARTPLQIFAAKTSFAEVGYTRKRSHGVTLLVRGLLYEQVVEGCILPNVWGQTAAVHHSLGLDGITEAKGYLTAFTTEKTATFRHSAAGQRQAAVVAKAEQGQGEGNEIESLQRRDASQGSVKCTTGTHDDGVATATDCTDDDLHEYIVNGSCSTVGRQTGASAVALGDVQESAVEAKALHKAVSAQQKARQELARVRAARANYLAGWSAYLGQIQELLQKQAEDHEQVLQGLDDGELQWTASLSTASITLQSKVGATVGAEALEGLDAEVLAEAQAEATEAKVDDQIALEQALKKQRTLQKESTQGLLAAVEQARAKAETDAAAADKERDRTPRRKLRPQPAPHEPINVSDGEDPTKQPPGKA